MLRRAVSIGVVALALTGCSDSDEPAPAEGEQEEATAKTSEEPALPETIPADDAKRVDLDQRLVRKVEIQEGPDWMASGFGALWVKRDSGTVDRIDPASGKVIAEISAGPFKNPLCQGIGVTEDAVWFCPPGAKEVVRIDPATNKITDTVQVDKLPDQGRIVSAAGHLWVLTDRGNMLTGIDLGDNKPSTEIPLESACVDLAAAGTTLWVTCPIDDLVLRVDAEAGEVNGEVELAGAQNAAVGQDLWVGFEGGVAQVDPSALEVTAVYDVSPRLGGSIFAGPDAVWVREEDGSFLTRIDPAEQRIVETIEAPDIPSGGDVIVIDDSVWATAYDDATLVQLQAER
jgi:streptogramin lyase